MQILKLTKALKFSTKMIKSHKIIQKLLKKLIIKKNNNRKKKRKKLIY